MLVHYINAPRDGVTPAAATQALLATEGVLMEGVEPAQIEEKEEASSLVLEAEDRDDAISSAGLQSPTETSSQTVSLSLPEQAAPKPETSGRKKTGLSIAAQSSSSSSSSSSASSAAETEPKATTSRPRRRSAFNLTPAVHVLCIYIYIYIYIVNVSLFVARNVIYIYHAVHSRRL